MPVAIGTRYRFLEALRDLSKRALQHSISDDEPLLTWIRLAHAQGQLAPDLTPDWIFQMTIALAVGASEAMQSGQVDQDTASRMLGETLVRAFTRRRPG